MDPKFESSLKTPTEIAQRLFDIQLDEEALDREGEELNRRSLALDEEKKALQAVCAHVLPNGVTALFTPPNNYRKYCRVCCQEYQDPPVQATENPWANQLKTGKPKQSQKSIMSSCLCGHGERCYICDT